MARNRDDDDDRISNSPRSGKRRDDDDEDRPRRRRRDEDDAEDDSPSLSRDQLRTVARSQKVIILCILGQLLSIPLQFVIQRMPPEMVLVASIGLLVFYIAVAITATVFVFMMAVNVYSTGTGVLLGLLTFVPCVGLIVLLIINSKATKIMKARGIRVGLLGANMSDVP